MHSLLTGSPVLAVDDIVAAMRDLIAANPDRVYAPPGGGANRTCSYVDSYDTPGTGCVVGEAVILLGVDREQLREWERYHGGDSHGLLVALDVIGAGFESVHPRYWVRRVQIGQDYGKSWGQALYMADRAHSED